MAANLDFIPLFPRPSRRSAAALLAIRIGDYAGNNMA
jgi:hypothetical protein